MDIYMYNVYNKCNNVYIVVHKCITIYTINKLNDT